MKLEPFHLYLEAYGLLCQKCQPDDAAPKAERLAQRSSDPELARKLTEPYQEMLGACTDISLPESPLFQRIFQQEGPDSLLFQELFMTYYSPLDSRPPLEQLREGVREKGIRQFLLNIPTDHEDGPQADNPSEAELLALLHEESITPEGRAAIFEVAMFPEFYIGQLAELLEKIAGRIEPILQKHRDKFRYAEEFFAAPELEGRMRDRVHLQVPENTIVFPSLSAFNYGLIYQLPGSETPYLVLGILFCGVDLFAQSRLSGEQIAARLKLLGDSTKLEILHILKEGPAYQAELAKRLKLTTPTVFHHMNLLAQRDFITDEVRDNRIFYHLNARSIDELIETLRRYLGLE